MVSWNARTLLAVDAVAVPVVPIAFVVVPVVLPVPVPIVLADYYGYNDEAQSC